MVRLALSMLVFVPAFTLFGAQEWGGDWYGWAVGGLIGVVFGLVFGGNPDWKIWDGIFGPREGDGDNP